ncbi:MAG: GDSL-type esterase/lipase family protein [Nanoarchaeota archaeon]|nr:GDSL-type esterase/lipase family protein [Nanoarchaeota archaeon]
MEKVICIFGASTTSGFWDLEKGGWVNRLRLYFDSKVNDDFYVTVYNLGIDGNNSGNLLKRFQGECEAREPDIIIISIGSNDSFINSKGKSNSSLKDFEENIFQIIKLAKKFTKKIIFLGLYDFDESKTKPVSWDANVNYINSIMKKYDLALKEIIEKADISYIDMNGLLENKDFEDGVHPNSRGHEKIFQKVKDFLIKKKLITNE